MSRPEKTSGDALLKRALKELARRNPLIAQAIKVAGPLPDRTLPKGFATLAKIVVEQQLSLASAAAIWRRLELDLGKITPASVLTRDVADLKSLGLGARKAEYVQGMARAVLDKSLELRSLNKFDDAEALAHLTAIRGVGPWTAEVYLLFAEGRYDMFPAGDVALQAAAHAALGLATRPGSDELRTLAEAWRPYRGTAARVLWRYYAVMKDGGV
jgi:DNA-3-methyladenine glycosylase II